MVATLTACGKDEKKRPDVTQPYMPEESGGGGGEIGTVMMSDVKQITVFNAGDDGVNSYRIPSVVTAKDGSLLVFAEARYTSWQDKSYTDVVVKRSTDGGLTWSSMKKITASINASAAYAFMDPLAVVDRSSGKIYLFCTRWPKGDATPTTTRAFMCVSNDNGENWTTPSDITAQIAAPDCIVSGFGPGAGFQIASGSYANRLIVPTRQYNPTVQYTYIHTVYSTDGGNNWITGNGIRPAGECSMADCGNNKLSLNVRTGGARLVGSSTDGGITWSAPSTANSGGLLTSTLSF